MATVSHEAMRTVCPAAALLCTFFGLLSIYMVQCWPLCILMYACNPGLYELLFKGNLGVKFQVLQQQHSVRFMLLYSDFGGRWDLSFLSEVITQIWLDPLRVFWGYWTTFTRKTFFNKLHLHASLACDHVTMEWTLNKISKIKFSVGYMVWPWCRLFQDSRPLKILIRYHSDLTFC